jgi:undecaprenyl-phosphate galactose phosphotransferase/putative colanic acid biosynthesis UDP-glucose lipid carrier transferase
LAYLHRSPDQLAVTASAGVPGPASRIVCYQNIGLLTAAADFAIIAASSLVGDVAYHYLASGSVDISSAQFAIGINSALLFVLLTSSRGLYRTRSLLSTREQLNGVFSAWLLVLLIAAALAFTLKVGSSYSRGSSITFGLLSLALLAALRLIIRANLREAILHGTLSGPRSIVVGDHEELAGLSAVDLLYKYGMREVGRVELPSSTNPGREAEIAEMAISTARATNAEQVLVALPWSDSQRRCLLSQKLRVLPLPVLLLPDRFADDIFSQATGGYTGHTLIELQRAPLSRLELVAKRTLDVGLAGLGLFLLLPLIILVCIAIKLDSDGPIIFKQNRRGFNGREFEIYKFRTMTVLENGGTILQATRNDKRVTRIGRLLRSTSIDELPQVINVLRGDMSLVGPRPHAIAHDSSYGKTIANYAFRHHVKPGITGWAQVNGLRGETAQYELMKKRIDFDLWYINNWSVWLDVWIVMRTCLEVVRGRNAY